MKDAATKTLPAGYTYDWGDQSREELKAGSQTMLILGLGLTFVFLILAALYESWKVPFAVLFSVPSGMIGAALVPFLLNFTGRFQLANDIYMQIGLLTLVGLAAKNAILIIEYAKIRVDERGMDIVDAAIEAAKIRLRPILMTSFAFIFWCIAIGNFYWCRFWCSYFYGYHGSSRYDNRYILWYLYHSNAFHHH